MTAPFAIRALMAIGVWALEATAVLAGAWVITLFIRKNAAMRHMTWLIAFCGLLLIPVFTATVPSRFAVRMPTPVLDAASESHPFIERHSAMPAEAVTTRASYGSVLAPSHHRRNAIAMLPKQTFDWAPVTLALLGIWAIGLVAIGCQMVLAFRRLRAIRRGCTIFDLNDSYIRGLASKVGLTRICEICVSCSDRQFAAMTWGFSRPVILLPKEQSYWPKKRSEAVLLHELAHVRRRDSTSQLLALGACAVFWFNPAVWLGLWAMRAEAESAADDLVLRAGVKPSAYATELLRIAAELGGLRQPYALVGVSIMKKCRIESRVKSIVDPANRRRGVTFAEAMLVGGAGLIAVPLLASVRPSIAFAPTNVVPPTVSVSALPPHLRMPEGHKSDADGEECLDPEEEAADGDSAVDSREARLAAPDLNRTQITSLSGLAVRLPIEIRANISSLKARNEAPLDSFDYQPDDRQVPAAAAISDIRLEYQNKRMVMREGGGARHGTRTGFNRRPEIYEPVDHPNLNSNLPGANAARQIYPPPTPYPVGPVGSAGIRTAVDMKMNVEPFHNGPIGFKFEANQFGRDKTRAVELKKPISPPFKWHPELADAVRGQFDAAEASLEEAIKRAPQRPEIIGQLKGILAGFRANKAREMASLLRFQPRPDEGGNLEDQMKGFQERVEEWARAMADEAREKVGAMQDLIDAKGNPPGDRFNSRDKFSRGRTGPCDGTQGKTPR